MGVVFTALDDRARAILEQLIAAALAASG